MNTFGMTLIPRILPVIVTLLVLGLFPLVPRLAEAETAGGETALQSPLIPLQEEILSYFRPSTGKVLSVEGNTATIDLGPEGSPRKGMRLHAFKEGVSFVHPVTKEPLGKVEIPVGVVEIAETGKGTIISGKPDDFVHAKLKIAGTKIKVLFSHGNVDWYLGDAYYQALKESGRFELFDTALETDDTAKILSEAKAKGAEAALLLSSQTSEDRVLLTQRLFWMDDARQFSEKSVSVEMSHIKDLKLKAGLLTPREGEALLTFSLPFRASRIAAGDLDGDGNAEIVLISGNDIKVYQLAVDLKLLWEFKVPARGDIVWIDTLVLGKNGRAALLVTTLRDDSFTRASDETITSKAAIGPVTSYVFELKGAEFVQSLKVDDMFIRKSGRGLIGQNHSRREGYEGTVFSVQIDNGAVKKGDSFKLPPGVNIYDFEFALSPDGRQAILAWDESGSLNLYNDKGVRIWMSKEDFGGFSTSFKKDSSTVMVERGKWSIKDRLIVDNAEILAPKRIPLAGVAKGLGYKRSEIRALWWNGLSVEDRPFVRTLSGEIIDYALTGNRVVVLAKPLFGVKTENILKGQNPLGVMVYIYSTQ